MRSRKR